MHPWSPEERDRFMSHITDTATRYFAFLRLLLSTGIRKGEALALTVNDIDLKLGRVRITKTWNSKTRKAGPPKTKSSRRSVKMPERTRIALREWIMATGVRGIGVFFCVRRTRAGQGYQEAYAGSRCASDPHARSSTHFCNGRARARYQPQSRTGDAWARFR